MILATPGTMFWPIRNYSAANLTNRRQTGVMALSGAGLYCEMMDRRALHNLLASLLVPALLAVASAGVRADEGGGSQPGPPNHNGDLNSGNNGNHYGWPESTPSGNDTPDHAAIGTAPADAGDHDAARRAVLDKTAIPLTEMMAIFKKSITGEVIDVSLIHGDAALRYRFKYIDGQGHVKRAFFDALSGQQL